MKVDVKAQGSKLNKSEILAEIASIADPKERAAFYFANKAALFGAR